MKLLKDPIIQTNFNENNNSDVNDDNVDGNNINNNNEPVPPRFRPFFFHCRHHRFLIKHFTLNYLKKGQRQHLTLKRQQ